MTAGPASDEDAALEAQVIADAVAEGPETMKVLLAVLNARRTHLEHSVACINSFGPRVVQAALDMGLTLDEITAAMKNGDDMTPEQVQEIIV